jgi:hypothetical protein
MSDTPELPKIPVPFIPLTFMLRHHLTNHLTTKRKMPSAEALALVQQVNDAGYVPHPILVEAIDAVLAELEAQLKKPGAPVRKRTKSRLYFRLADKI